MQTPLNAAEKLLVLLSHYPYCLTAHVYPREMTQHGISEELGVSRAYIAKELKKLHERGQVDVTVARVVEARKKRKIYFLTKAGEEEARVLAEVTNGVTARPPRSDGGNGGTPNRFGGDVAGPGCGGS